MTDRAQDGADTDARAAAGAARLDRATVAEVVQFAIVPRLLMACRAAGEDARGAGLIAGMRLYMETRAEAAPGASPFGRASSPDDDALTASETTDGSAALRVAGMAGTYTAPYAERYAAGRELD